MKLRGLFMAKEGIHKAICYWKVLVEAVLKFSTGR